MTINSRIFTSLVNRHTRPDDGVEPVPGRFLSCKIDVRKLTTLHLQEAKKVIHLCHQTLYNR